MLIATLLMSVMYIAVSLSLAELSAAMPYTGGAYAFTRIAFGPSLGFAAGIAQIVEFTLAAAAVAVGLGAYVRMLALQAGLDLPNIVWWAVLYVVFIGLNIHGVVTLFRLAIGLAVVALLALVAFWIRAVPQFDLALALDIVPKGGGRPGCPTGSSASPGRCPSPSGSIWRSRRWPWQRRKRGTRRAVPRGFAWGIGTWSWPRSRPSSSTAACRPAPP